jgi:hypothetical protein
MKNLMNWLFVMLVLATVAMFPRGSLGQSTNNYSVCQGVTEPYWIQNPGVGSTFAWTITPGVSGSNWTIVANNNDSINVLWILPGVYTVQVIETNNVGCLGDPIQLQVTVVQTPTIANAGPDNQVCGLTTSLSGNNPAVGTGTWTQVSGPGTSTFTNPNMFNTSVTVTVQGVYVYKWSIVNGVCPASEDMVQITFFALPTVANAGTDAQICGLTGTLNGNNPVVGTGTWAQVSGPGASAFNNPNLYNTSVTVTAQGVYIYTWTISNGVCTASVDSVQFTFYDYPTIANAGTDAQVCSLTDTLNGNNPSVGTGTWTQVSGPGTSLFTNPNLFNTSVTVSIQGVYVFKWTISNGTCTPSEDQVQITFYSSPTIANAGQDQTLCGVLTTNLAGNVPAIGTGTWSQISGPGVITFTNVNDPLTSITASTAGTYVLRWTITNGTCLASTDDVTITMSPAIIVTATSNSPVCEGNTLELYCDIAGATYSWTGPGGWISNVQNPTRPNATPAMTGTYNVVVSNIPGGCPDTSDAVDVTVNPKPITNGIWHN